MKGRVLFAGTGSGAGKTTITCSVLFEMIKRGLKVASFKCGPDYIDPMFHRKVIGNKSYNLDSCFLEKEKLKKHFMRCAGESEYCVMEGVMGYYDGAGFSLKGSSYEIADMTNTPVILIINGKGMGNSIGAVLKGFLSYVEDSHIKGVIVNQVTKRTYEKMAEQIRVCGMIPCGYLDRLNEDIMLESRHLGLITANEVEGIQERLARLSEQVCKTVDVDAVLRIADLAGSVLENPKADVVEKGNGADQVVIAVARDAAFSFYYEENLELLEEKGCEIVYFSPMQDEKLPQNACGLLLGGGYPEIYAKELSANEKMRSAVKAAVESGMPVIAECGGYMYLKTALESEQGEMYPMVGVLPDVCRRKDKLVRFGYVSLEAREDNVLCQKGEQMMGHEFHYWDSEENGDAFLARRILGEETYTCGYASETMYAGFAHLYFPANEMMVERFVKKCRAFEKGN